MDHTDLADDLIEAAFELRRALRGHMDGVGTDETLPLAQSDVLHDIGSHPGSRIGDVAIRLRLRPNTVSTLVTALANKGLIEKRADLADGRVSTLHVTGERGARRDRRSERRASVVAAELGKLDDDSFRALSAALPVLNEINAALRA